MLVDPVASIIKLDPSYEQKLEEEKGTDLKTAINNASNTILITAPVMRAKDAVYGKPSTLAKTDKP